MPLSYKKMDKVYIFLDKNNKGLLFVSSQNWTTCFCSF